MIPKFRAFLTKKKVMADVKAIHLTQEKIIGTYDALYDIEEMSLMSTYCCSLKNVILMQSTGLKDRNNKEIYEGDIIKYGNNLYKIIKDVASTLSLVRLNESFIDYDDFEKNIYDSKQNLIWCGQKHDYVVTLYDIVCNLNDANENLNCEIVGNIYENFELLKED